MQLVVQLLEHHSTQPYPNTHWTEKTTIKIEKWENGLAPEHKNWENISIRPVLQDNKINNAVKMRALYILMGEPRGIDLELYKILTI